VNCRGALVGHEVATAAEFSNGTCTRSLPVEADGVLSVTVFHGDQPLAERLVFREPRRKLSFHVTGLQGRYAPGDRVRLSWLAADEAGAPAAAVVGLGVVDDTLAQLARPPVPRLTTHFWLWGDLQSPERLADANILLAPTPAARQALDLVLGTQGWRRFRQVPALHLGGGAARGLAQGTTRGAAEAEVLSRSTANPLADEALVMDGYLPAGSYVDVSEQRPLRLDNADKLAGLPMRALAAKSVAVESAPRPRPALWTWIAVMSGIVLVAAIAVFALRVASSRLVVVGGMAVATKPPAGAASAANNDRVLADLDGVAYSAPQEEMGAAVPAQADAPGGFGEKSMPELRFGVDARPPAASSEPQSAVPLATSTPLPSTSPAARPEAVSPLQRAGRPELAPASSVREALPQAPAAESSALRLQVLKKDALDAADGRDAGASQRMSTNAGQSAAPVPAESAARSVEARNGFRRSRAAGGVAGTGEQLREAVKDSDPQRLGARGGSRGVDPFYYRREFAPLLGRAATVAPGKYGPETLFWNPLMVAGADGRIDIEFDLPRAASKYRVLVEGHVDGRLGSGSAALDVSSDR
jgi:hypothetical protein